MSRLVRSRPCNGACCRATPLRATEDGSDCVFRDPKLPERGCRIMEDMTLLDELTPEERDYFLNIGCEPWPQNETPETCDLTVCCWSWSDGGD